MNVLQEQSDRLIAEGARPWRFDPNWRPGGTTPAFSAKVPILFAFVAGFIFCMALAAALALCMGWRPAREADIRLAAIVRAALPDPEAFAPHDVIARLAVPPEMGKLLAPLVEDPDAAPMADDWIAALIGREPLRVEPGRMDALRLFANHLGTLPSGERTRVLDSTMELSRALVDPGVAQFMFGIVTLPRAIISNIVQSRNFFPVLESISRLTEDQRWIIANANFAESPFKLQILSDINNIDVNTIKTILNFMEEDQRKRPPVNYFINQILIGDPSLERLLAAYALHNPDVLQIVATLSRDCSFRETKKCR